MDHRRSSAPRPIRSARNWPKRASPWRRATTSCRARSFWSTARSERRPRAAAHRGNSLAHGFFRKACALSKRAPRTLMVARNRRRRKPGGHGPHGRSCARSRGRYDAATAARLVHTVQVSRRASLEQRERAVASRGWVYSRLCRGARKTLLRVRAQ
jgi:hypothetical protein